MGWVSNSQKIATVTGASYGCSRKDTRPWIHSSRDPGVFEAPRLVDLVDISGDGLVNYLEWLGLTAPF